MTLLAGLLSVLVSVVGSLLIMTIGQAAALRARAQTAADAAALAAVAESTPYGTGVPENEARRYAIANHARLVECLCDEGATAVQVTVTVDGVTAEARAVFDPELVAPAEVSDRLHPLVDDAVDRLVTASGGAVSLVSGWRSPVEQERLWEAALAEYGSAEAADDWVARPGSSMHERGLAVDLGGDLALAVRLIDRLGLPLHRPLPNEPWHFELIGSR